MPEMSTVQGDRDAVSCKGWIQEQCDWYADAFVIAINANAWTFIVRAAAASLAEQRRRLPPTCTQA